MPLTPTQAFALASRDRQPEWMDAPGLPPGLHRDALRGLSRINAVSRTVPSVWHPLNAFMQRRRLDHLCVLDLACGGGDLAIGLARRARHAGRRLTVHGCDISQTALAFAEEHARQHRLPIRFYRHDVLGGDLPGKYDAVVTSLFLHHLERQDAVNLLARCGAAVDGLLIVTDLNRSAAGFVLAWLGTRLLSRSPVVHVDGVRSVRAAFSRAEAHELATQAGLVAPGFQTTVTPQWPCRWRLVAERLQ